MMAKVTVDQNLAVKSMELSTMEREGLRQADVSPNLKPALQLLTNGHQMFDHVE